MTARDMPGDAVETNPIPALTPRQLAVIRELVAGRRVGEIVARFGVHRQTIWRWRRDPNFQRELDRAHRELLVRKTEA